MKETLNEILQRMLSTVDAGVAFLSAEIPDVIQQLLVWKAVSSGLFFLFWLFVNIFLLKSLTVHWNARDKETLSKRYMKRNWEEDSYVNTFNCLLLIIGVLWIISAIGVMASTSWLKIIIAPKVYLIEYAASLIK